MSFWNKGGSMQQAGRNSTGIPRQVLGTPNGDHQNKEANVRIHQGQH